MAKRSWADEIVVGNDTFALLRAGTERGWGVAVVCGAGINCVGVAPDGRRAALPGARRDHRRLGRRLRRRARALSAAARSEDGRGPKTSLEESVPAFFGLETPRQLAEAMHEGRVEISPLDRARPARLRRGAHDEVAAEIVEPPRRRGRGARAGRADAARAQHQPVEVLLGGGLLRRGEERLLAAVVAGLAEVGDEIVVRTTESPPIVGAALLGLDRLGASAEAKDRARREVAAAADAGDESRDVPFTWSGGTAWLRFGTKARRASTPGSDIAAVDALDLQIADGEFIVLVGPSGSGKTTALRMLAGLEEVDAGAILIGDRDVTDVRPRTATSRWCSRTTRCTRT